jgi:ribosomal protein L11 methyltransferase
MSGALWRLVANGKMDVLRPAYDVLSDLEEPLALTVSLFERGPGLAALEALFDSAPDADAFLRAAGIEAAALDHVHVAPLPDEDWVAMSLKGLKPVTAGRFFVHGSHDAPQGDTPILIEANQAFGTGHHGTTRGCLLAFDALLGGGTHFTNVLDLGCGAGTLAIAAAKTTTAAVTASDNDPLAIEVTRENLAVNGVGVVEAIVAEGLDHPDLVRRAPYDLVFANILAGPLVILAPSIARSLQTGGRVILSGLLEEQRNMVASAYETERLELESEAVLDGWSTLVMLRP